MLPSSGGLARAMLAGLDIPNRQSVCEFGPGTGAFTQAILTQLGEQTRFFAIEKSHAMSDVLRQKFPHVSVHTDSILNVADCCKRESVGGIDVIVCGLPWASFDHDFQSAGLKATWDILRPGGRFVTFAYSIGTYLPTGRRFAKSIRQQFAKVETSPIVWANFPPAFVYRCTK